MFLCEIDAILQENEIFLIDIHYEEKYVYNFLKNYNASDFLMI